MESSKDSRKSNRVISEDEPLIPDLEQFLLANPEMAAFLNPLPNERKIQNHPNNTQSYEHDLSYDNFDTNLDNAQPYSGSTSGYVSPGTEGFFARDEGVSHSFSMEDTFNRAPSPIFAYSPQTPPVDDLFLRDNPFAIPDIDLRVPFEGGQKLSPGSNQKGNLSSFGQPPQYHALESSLGDIQDGSRELDHTTRVHFAQTSNIGQSDGQPSQWDQLSHFQQPEHEQTQRETITTTHTAVMPDDFQEETQDTQSLSIASTPEIQYDPAVEAVAPDDQLESTDYEPQPVGTNTTTKDNTGEAGDNEDANGQEPPERVRKVITNAAYVGFSETDMKYDTLHAALAAAPTDDTTWKHKPDKTYPRTEAEMKPFVVEVVAALADMDHYRDNDTMALKMQKRLAEKTGHVDAERKAAVERAGWIFTSALVMYHREGPKFLTDDEDFRDTIRNSGDGCFLKHHTDLCTTLREWKALAIRAFDKATPQDSARAVVDDIAGMIHQVKGYRTNNNIRAEKAKRRREILARLAELGTATDMDETTKKEEIQSLLQELQDLEKRKRRSKRKQKEQSEQPSKRQKKNTETNEGSDVAETEVDESFVENEVDDNFVHNGLNDNATE